MSQEFDELIFSYMTLDSEQKKTTLLSLLSDNIQNVFDMMKKDGIDVKYINTDILNNLDIKNNNDYLTYVYVLVRQLEDLTSKYIVSKSPNL